MSDRETSYRNTALLGLSSVANILLSVVRNKIFAIYLAPSGIGKLGLLNDFVNSVTSVGSLGVASSGVQAVGKASTQSGEAVRRLYNALVLVFTAVSFVLLLATIGLARPISFALGGDASYSLYLRIAAFALLLKFRSVLQSLLVAGMKRVGLIAKGTILQGVVTTALGISLVMALGDGAVPYLILSFALGTWLVTHLQAREVAKDLPASRERVPIAALRPVLALGVSSLWATLLENGVNITNKSWINHRFGQEYLGYYQVAVGFTTAYIGFITSSIITNYYPHLVTKVQEGKQATNDYVNEQIGISMALIMPLLLMMLTFRKLFLLILFSAKFLAAADLIGYTVAGTFIQVVAWPIAFVFLAREATKTYIFTESVGNGTMLLFSYLAMRSGQFSMLGLAYVLHYAVYLVVITYLFIRRFEGTVTSENVALFGMNAIIIAGIVIAKGFLSETASYLVGGVLILFYCYRSRNEYRFMLRTILRRR